MNTPARVPLFQAASLLLVLLAAVGCAHQEPAAVGSELARTGDEISVCGRLFHTGAPVVLWTDPGGYDAYRTEKRFEPWERAPWSNPPSQGRGPETPNRFGLRFDGRGNGVYGAPPLSAEDLEAVRGGGWTLDMLRARIDQFVIHYDVCGTSRQCFHILHDVRGLSVHFMLDLDGTVYQTLDLKERAWHATSSNDRSIGIEIANIGAYPVDHSEVLDRWYARTTHEGGKATVRLPDWMGDGGIRTPGFRAESCGEVVGVIQGTELRQYDLTEEQYDSLIKLTAALCRVLPRIRCDYPRDEQGQLIRSSLSEAQLAAYSGLLGHYHVTNQKSDPGPAFQWDKVVGRANQIIGHRTR